MDCPTCRRPLKRTTYENIQVMQCEECFGYLVARTRLKLIKGSREQKPEALASAAQTERAPDTQERIRCPHCRVESMRKERVRVGEGEGEEFHLDVCRKCDRVWLDGGELARLQMKFEQSAKALEAFARQERLQTFDDEKRTELEERIDKLRERSDVFGASLTEVGFGVAGLLLVVLIVLTTFFESLVWAGTFSLALCGVFVWAIFKRLDATDFQGRVALAAVGIAEALFLIYLIWFY
jgi:Zn-finger nucleic acid-binding protein